MPLYREDLERDRGADGGNSLCQTQRPPVSLAADFPHEVVRSRFLKLDSDHIRVCHGQSCRKNTTEVRNMKQYLLDSAV